MRPLFSVTVAVLCLATLTSFLAQDDVSPEGAVADALEAAQFARSADPDDPSAMEALSEAYGAAGDADGELSYLLISIDGYERAEFDSEDEKAAKLKALEKRLDKLDKGLGPIRKARDKYLGDLTWALRLYAGNQNKHRNALELASRILAYRPDHPSAGRAVKELLSELDPSLGPEAKRLLGQKDLRRPRSFLRTWSEEHREWGDAGSFESDRYIVKTNAGYDVGQIASKSLSAIADYYQDFYGVDRSLVSQRTPVLLTKTWEEFKTVADNPITDSPGLLAFIRSQRKQTSDGDIEIEFTVFGFDPRDRGRPLSSLWPTLWHEASHEYMSLVCEGKSAPAWFNEGMSSYFEGATFSDKGEIGVGRPARSRLDNLYGMLNRDEKPVRGVVHTIERLNGAQYAVVWGIVYYLRHGRDEDGKLLRPGAIDKALDMLRGGVMTSPGLFEGAVLSANGETLEAFEAEWIEAMKALHVAESDPIARAEELTEMGAKRRADGDLEDAEQLFGEALLRNPSCMTALEALVDLHREAWLQTKKRDDRAADNVLYWARRLYDAHLNAGDEAGMDTAVAFCTEVDRSGHKRIAKAEIKYRERLEALLGKLSAGDRPKTAIAVARLYVDDVLGTARAKSLAAELRASEVLVLERPLHAFDEQSLMGWSGSPKVFSVEDEMIVATAGRPFASPLTLDRPLSPLFRFEGDVMVDDANTMFGVTFSAPESEATAGFVMRPKRPRKAAKPPLQYAPFDSMKSGQVAVLTEKYDERILTVGYALEGRGKKMRPPLEVGKWARFSLAMTEPGVLTFTVDGEEIATTEVPVDASAASVSLLVYGGSASIANVAAVELDIL